MDYCVPTELPLRLDGDGSFVNQPIGRYGDLLPFQREFLNCGTHFSERYWNYQRHLEREEETLP